MLFKGALIAALVRVGGGKGGTAVRSALILAGGGEFGFAILSLSRHVILCGYGRTGQNVARFLENEGIPYLALDLGPERVQEARAAGDPVSFGDASRQ
jgi:voltage-gated potassium channel Kch